MSYKLSPETLNKIGTININRLYTIRDLRDELCRLISDENNLQEVKAIADELGINSNRKKKKDLCQEISDSLAYEQGGEAPDEQGGGARGNRYSDFSTKVRSILREKLGKDDTTFTFLAEHGQQRKYIPSLYFKMMKGENWRQELNRDIDDFLSLRH